MKSILQGGGRRTKVGRVGITILALAAFQVLAVIGAGAALAVTACTYNPATGAINITIDPGDTAYVAVETANDLDAESPVGAILFTDAGYDYENGAASTQCGSASVSNTTSIVVLGQPSADEGFYIDEWANDDGGQFPASIAWAIDLGSNSTTFGDFFGWWSTDTDARDDTMTLTNTTFDLNGAAGTLFGVESFYYMYGGGGDDVIDASATTIYGDLEGVAGDDWIAPGTFAALPATADDLFGGVGEDTLSYATRTTSTTIDNAAGQAGHDVNGDCDVVDAGDEQDLISGFEVLETGSGNDCFFGGGGVETFVPGDGDDDITGQAVDTIDWSSSSAGMVIDPALGTATGQGTDTFDGPTNFVGSALDDTLIWDGTTTGFVGGDGTDKVDASARTVGNTIDLDILDGTPVSGVGAPADTLENAIGGSANDSLLGNDTRNRLDGGEGDDTLSGFAGNDFLIGGAGNDNYSGGDGADKVSFKNSPNGITADLLAGFATGEGDDSLSSGDIEIVVGSQFKDSITGGGGTVATNFNFVGNNGKDTLTGSGSNDTMKGGGGKDVLRGVGGDDTLVGGNGNDRIFGGGGTDIGNGGNGKDECKGVEIRNSCGKPGNPRIAAGIAAKLGRL